MSREIKFRAINAKNELIYGLPCTDGINENVYFEEYKNRLCWRNEKRNPCNQPYENGTFMQYTGLKDKNKEEIYEGDIVRIDDVLGKIITTYIYYSLGAFRYRHDDGSGSVLDMITTSKVKGYESVTKDIEVVGNIYENPELFEEIESLKNNS